MHWHTQGLNARIKFSNDELKINILSEFLKEENDFVILYL